MDFTMLKDFMDYLTTCKSPGNSISIYHNHKEIFRYSAGYSSIEEKTPMRGNELFNIYSCSKLATVTAALQLYEKGIYLLDDPLYDFIPEFKNICVKDANGNIRKAKNDITIRHLFTHTAGFSYASDTDNFKELYERTNGVAPTLEVARTLAKEPLRYDPGTDWYYSWAHDVLAAFVEVVSGENFGNYVKNHIFTPIGIDDLYYHENDKIKARMAEQYRHITDVAPESIVDAQFAAPSKDGYFKNVGKDNALFYGTEFDSGGAGIVTSLDGYATFADALACGGVATNGERILSSATVELLHTDQLSDELRTCIGWTSGSQRAGYSYGLGVKTLVDKAAGGSLSPLGEFGWGGAAGSTILADTKNGFSYFFAQHVLNPQETYYQPRLRNVAYACFKR